MWYSHLSPLFTLNFQMHGDECFSIHPRLLRKYSCKLFQRRMMMTLLKIWYCENSAVQSSWFFRRLHPSHRILFRIYSKLSHRICWVKLRMKAFYARAVMKDARTLWKISWSTTMPKFPQILNVRFTTWDASWKGSFESFVGLNKAHWDNAKIRRSQNQSQTLYSSTL